MPQFKKFLQLTKVNEAERTVTGVAMSESVDYSGEAMHYDSTKPHVEAWSGELSKATNGENLGNVREMHGTSAAGCITDIVYDDVAKTITVTAKVVDDSAWNKVMQKVYTGFSIGGKYLKKWIANGVRYYTGKPAELSLVDAPCNPDAYFTLSKANGETEQVKLPVRETVSTILVDVPGMDAALVPELAKRIHAAVAAEATWLAEDDEDDRQALGLSKRAEVPAMATAINAMLGAESLTLEKGLWEVSDLAMLLSSLRRITACAAAEAADEGDNSPVPAKLKAAFKQLADAFLEMAAEEVDEAVAMKMQVGDLQKRADDDLLKFTALTTERDDLQKRFDAQTLELTKVSGELATLKAQPAAPKGALFKVDRTTPLESAEGEQATEEDAMTKVKAMPDGPEKTDLLLKMVYRAGPMH